MLHLDPPDRATTCAFVLLAALTASDPAAAQVFNTGVNAANVPLAVGSSDTHWNVVSGPGVLSAFPAIASTINFQYAVSPASTWIWVAASAVGQLSSPYVFRLTFNIAAPAANLTVLSGAWAADNFGSILLNGVAASGSGELSLAGAVTANFNQFHPFTINTGFLSGANTLDFSITDVGAVGGLNVTNLMISTVPELAAQQMYLVGISALVIGLRRRAAQTVA